MWDMLPCWRGAIIISGCNVIASSPWQQHFCALTEGMGGGFKLPCKQVGGGHQRRSSITVQFSKGPFHSNHKKSNHFWLNFSGFWAIQWRWMGFCLWCSLLELHRSDGLVFVLLLTWFKWIGYRPWCDRFTSFYTISYIHSVRFQFLMPQLSLVSCYLTYK